MYTGYLAEARSSAFRVVGWQSLAALLAGVVGFLAGGIPAGEAALTGGLIAAAAQFAVTLRVFGGMAERNPKRFMARLILGEALKFAVTIAMFLVALVILKTAFLPLILGYMAGFVAYWFGYIRSSFGRDR